MQIVKRKGEQDDRHEKRAGTFGRLGKRNYR
jgi:hypothetical protein